MFSVEKGEKCCIEYGERQHGSGDETREKPYESRFILCLEFDAAIFCNESLYCFILQNVEREKHYTQKVNW